MNLSVVSRGNLHTLSQLVDFSSSLSWNLHREKALPPKSDTRVVPISLSRNFCHQIALTAAIDFADGDVVVIMDGDLQDRPEIIPAMLNL
jgi:glycosyltransferase involved in cell wall biosynthesis